jgi:Na+/H+-dicarboxylate symporter
MTDTAVPLAAPLAARLYRLALNPWLVLACLIAGAAVGSWQPQWASRLGVVGAVYVDLLQMIVLPFMVSAVIFSLQHLFREGGASRTLARVLWVFLAFATVVAAVGLAGAHLAAPGADLSSETRTAFGRIIGSDVRQSSAQVTLRASESDTESSGEVSLREVLGVLVPSNVFAAFAQGEALKALVFALLFGFAAGQVPGRVSQGLIDALETVYTTCQTLTRWFNFPVPLVLFCMAAAQIGQRGFDTLRPMAGFVLTFIACAALLVVMAVGLIHRRSGQSWAQVLEAMRAPFAMAVVTRSSAVCMPVMIESLADKLGFARLRVELLVPLSVSLLRTGPILYYISATLFIAALYGRELTLQEIGLVAVVSVIAGFASAGASGVVTLSMLGTTSGYLGLPFEAAFILFVAVEPVCDIARTVLIVIGNCAAVAAICPEPLKV